MVMWKKVCRFLSLYGHMASISLRSQMQHRSSFLMLIVAQFLSGLTEILIPLTLCSRFKKVAGFAIADLALFYGIVHMGFALSEILCRGFDKFDQQLVRGDFDRFLTRPLGTLFQVLSSEITGMKIGRFFQGLLAFWWGIIHLSFPIGIFHLVLFFMSLFGTCALFCGVFILQGCLAFYLKATIEIMHMVTYGGRSVGEYPISIFPVLFRLFFTYIVPLSLVVFYPISSLLTGSMRWYAPLFPCAGYVFLLFSIWMWKLSSKQYQSTGS